MIKIFGNMEDNTEFKEMVLDLKWSIYLKLFHVGLKIKRQVILTTYSEDDEHDKEFIIPKKFFLKYIKEQGWKDENEFFDSYVYDDSEFIYDEAKETNNLISEKLVSAQF